MSLPAALRQDIVMNFSRPPSLDDMGGVADMILKDLPLELTKLCAELEVAFEDIPDDALCIELNLETPYELLAHYRQGGEISPGVQKKTADDNDTLVLFRRPILDLWCETNEDLAVLLREIMIEEIAQAHEFSEDDIASFLRNR
jgi:predicted Zn-dependent protease with MMP-like domain